MRASEYRRAGASATAPRLAGDPSAEVPFGPMTERIKTRLARLIPVRPWIALSMLLLGIAISIPSFYYHDLWTALVGLALMGGALGFLLIPLPYPR